jgi:hypothetical protein
MIKKKMSQLKIPLINNTYIYIFYRKLNDFSDETNN